MRYHERARDRGGCRIQESRHRMVEWPDQMITGAPIPWFGTAPSGRSHHVPCQCRSRGSGPLRPTGPITYRASPLPVPIPWSGRSRNYAESRPGQKASLARLDRASVARFYAARRQDSRRLSTGTSLARHWGMTDSFSLAAFGHARIVGALAPRTWRALAALATLAIVAPAALALGGA